MISAEHIVQMIIEYSFWFLVCFGLFSSLALLFPNIKGQSIIRKGMITDTFYWFFIPLFYLQAGQWMLVGFSFLIFQQIIDSRSLAIDNFNLFNHLPVVYQTLIFLLFLSFFQYWTHRLFHGKVLWSFHAIHHATKELDWLSGVRFHPINMLFHSVLGGTLIALLGFSSITYIIMFPVEVLYAAMVHANLNWTFGPLRYVFASPVFHRFHHTKISEGGEKNFSPFISLFDVIFGTFYMPKGRLPEEFGVNESVPESLLGQLAYPFKKE